MPGLDPRHEPSDDGIARTTAHLVSADGTPLRVRSWRPAVPRASLAVVHGLAEHGDRYAAFATHLAARGLAVHAIDLRGHGDSGGIRVHVGSFDEYVADTAALRAHARGADPARPAFLLGHSMGALVAMLSVIRDPRHVDGLVVTSPFLEAHPARRAGPLLRAVAAVLLRVAPRLQVSSGVSPDLVSRDPAVVAAYRDDPRMSRTVSAGWFRALRRAQAEAREAASAWAVPTLVLAAGDDRLVDRPAIEEWIARAPAGLMRAAVLPGLFHEILNEPERDAVYARIVAWLAERT